MLGDHTWPLTDTMAPTMSGCPLQTWRMPKTMSRLVCPEKLLVEELPDWGVTGV